MKKAILWDLDGTLLYTLKDIAGASNATLRRFGYPEHSVQAHLDFVGNGAANQLRCALGFQPENFEEMLLWYKEYYLSHYNETSQPYDGIPEAVEILRREGWLHGMVTNKPHPIAQALCRAHFPAFDLCLGETAGIARKPSRDMVDLALRELGAEEAIFIGDSEVDVHTARAANIPCIAVTWGYRSEAVLKAAGARYICGSPRELPALVKEISHGK